MRSFSANHLQEQTVHEVPLGLGAAESAFLENYSASVRRRYGRAQKENRFT